MTIRHAIPGAEELAGKGVYPEMPKDVPRPVGDAHAVVVGEPVECAAVARQLGEAGWKVTAVTGESGCGCGMRRGCSRRVRTEVVWAAGIEHLEAVVLRRIDTGRIEACNASALFIL